MRGKSRWLVIVAAVALGAPLFSSSARADTGGTLTASFTFTQTGTNDMTANFDASSSTSPAGDPIVSYSWFFDYPSDPAQNVAQNEPTLSVTYPDAYASEGYRPTWLTVKDQSGQTAQSATMNVSPGDPIVVNGSNSFAPPQFYAGGHATVAPLAVSVDHDPRDSAGSGLSITGVTQPKYGTCTLDPLAAGEQPSQQTLTYTPNGTFTGRGSPWYGTDSCSVTVADTLGFSTTAVLNTSVIPPNAPKYRISSIHPSRPDRPTGSVKVQVTGNDPSGSEPVTVNVNAYKSFHHAVSAPLAYGESQVVTVTHVRPTFQVYGGYSYLVWVSDPYGDEASRQTLADGTQKSAKIKVPYVHGIFDPHGQLDVAYDDISVYTLQADAWCTGKCDPGIYRVRVVSRYCSATFKEHGDWDYGQSTQGGCRMKPSTLGKHFKPGVARFYYLPAKGHRKLLAKLKITKSTIEHPN